MHELPILRDIVTVAVEYADRAEADRVVSVELAVGELRDLDPEWMQRYFSFATAGTKADGARLVVTRSKALFLCGACSTTFGIDLRARTPVGCPSCRSDDVELTTGNELRIESIDVLKEQP